MKLTFLGTSCMMPTAERNHPAVVLTWEGENMLFDCGENTQRQLRIAGISPTAITKILITHWHGDHILGLPGLIQSMMGSNYSRVLEIYGPKFTKKNVEHMLGSFALQGAKMKILVKEVHDSVFLATKDFSLEALPVKHSVPCVAYAFQELPKRKMNLGMLKKLGIPHGPLFGKLQRGEDVVFNGKKVAAKKATILVPGKRVVYLTDTSLVENCYKIAKNADVLVSESTYAHMEEAKAKEKHHLTAGQAALIAKKAKVKKLALMHFSQRYKQVDGLLKEAQAVFKNTTAMNDFDIIIV